MHCMYTMYSGVGSSLTSQTYFCKKGKGVVNCVNKLCPVALYIAVQSQCSVLLSSPDTLFFAEVGLACKTT